MAEKQPLGMKKLPIPPLPTTAYTTKTVKPKQTNEEKQARKKELDRDRNKTRVNIGVAFPRWRELRDLKGYKNDAEFATVLLDRYLQTQPQNQPASKALKSGSSAKACESVNECQLTMSSESEDEPETSAAPSVQSSDVQSPDVQSSENGKESSEKDAVCQRVRSQDEGMATNQSENKENRVINTDLQEDEEEEFNTSLIVGDGLHQVDLGSSSEFIVDEECILQLFQSCQECNRQCRVRKQVKGLKLVVNQSCCFCQHRSKWTNLSDDDGGRLQMNGKDAAHGQTNSAVSQSESTS
uniref:uncharacterized protein isoform X1 n=1 Tax=Semicossyphus pulcher TaxID=241346 RepID=UPI0037E6F857